VTKNPPRLVQSIGLPLMSATMFSIAGGHWVVLQVIAWQQMPYAYSRNSTVVEAVTKTFDGNHPCTLCCTIRHRHSGEESERTHRFGQTDSPTPVAAEFFVSAD
jgi:hypothetical protein